MGVRFGEDEGLLLAKNQINNPAATDMNSFLAAVVKDIGVVAARFLQGVRQNGQSVEGLVVVDRLGHFRDRPIAPVKPCRVERHGAEGE